MFRANIGVSDLSDIIEITETDVDGRFICPKCKVEVDPELESEFEVLDELQKSVYLSVLIRHKCGQKLRIVISGEAK